MESKFQKVKENIGLPKNKQKLLFIRYVCVLYIPLEIPLKGNFENSDKIWPTPPASYSPQKLVPDFKMAKNGCLSMVVWYTVGKVI